MSTLRTMAAATSSGSTVGMPLPSGAPEANSVRTALGSTQLTLTPVFPYSLRSATDSPTAPNLDAL
ncbi:Uncharacterised protein [Mycobacteroides abscessus subsp. abscessus]|nr:Uncharacterised protein [Mycobacteroides abscessus subsp. abscessus]SKU03360.1 Uncharacterised protein [Mycobacteroides abscessus subsp. abscessus]